MRLKPEEVSKIISVLGQFMIGPADLYLYGSRVDDSLKGGDIDLIVVCEDALKEKLEDKKIEILVALKKGIGDRRIDLSFHPSLPTMASVNIHLKSWP